MTDDLTADEILHLLDLEPNATCGSVRVTFTSHPSITPGGLPAPFADGRPLGSALHFLVTPDAPVRPLRICNDQLYHAYLGDPLEVFLLLADGTSERVVAVVSIAGGVLQGPPLTRYEPGGSGSPLHHRVRRTLMPAEAS